MNLRNIGHHMPSLQNIPYTKADKKQKIIFKDQSIRSVTNRNSPSGRATINRAFLRPASRNL